MKFKYRIKQNYGLLLLLATFASILLFKKHPSIIEEIYSNGIFVGIKAFYTFFLSWIPFPIIYLVFTLLLILTIRLIRNRNLGILSKVRKFANAVAYIVCIFYWFWGINYFRIPFQERVGYNSIEISKPVFISELRFMILELDSLEKEYTRSEKGKFSELQDEMNTCIQSTMKIFGYKFLGNSRIRQFYPSGNLLRISTAGIYLPFSFEGHIDGGLHDLQKPFTMMHEFFHGQGFTDEGICNFLAYVGTCQSNDPWIRYSGAIGYWRYLQSQGFRSRNEEVLKIVRGISPEVKNDIFEISETMKKYPDIMPKLRDKVYDTYLKSNGVKAGLHSYSQMVRYVIRWRDL